MSPLKWDLFTKHMNTGVDGVPTRTRTWSSGLGGRSFILLNYGDTPRIILKTQAIER